MRVVRCRRPAVRKRGAPDPPAIGAAVVRHHALDSDAAGRVPSAGPVQEAHGGRRQLILQHFAVGHTARIIDGGVQDLPADAFHPPRVIPMDTMADAADPAELLRVDVQQLAGALALIPHHGRRRLEARQAGQALPPLLGDDRRIGSLSSNAMLSEPRRCRRSRPICRRWTRGKRCGIRRGRLDRSASVRSPASQRRTHSRSRRPLIPTPRATTPRDSPLTTRRTASTRPNAVIFAFLCMFTGASVGLACGLAT